MIESIQFKNFKVLRDATLPLGRCNILVGPNGSGKTTVLQALDVAGSGDTARLPPMRSVGMLQDPIVRLILNSAAPFGGVQYLLEWEADKGHRQEFRLPEQMDRRTRSAVKKTVRGIKVFSFDATALAAPVDLKQKMELARNGAGLAGVLDRLRDHHEDRFEALNDEFSRWLPEFDRITFDLDANNRRVFLLRIRDGGHEISATDVSQGTLIALAILTLAYLPEPPSVIGLEEPDRGIHPRLLRRVKDALHRLSHPESCGEDRGPVQVIATTHSPYFLDLFKDHPEKIIICERVGQEVQFKRVSDLAHIEEILGDAPLGEAWYTGILGGVPSEP